MSYLPRTSAQGSMAGARSNMTTPTSRTVRPEDEGRLSYKPSQLPWVKLTWDAEPNAGFYSGRSVQIYAAQQYQGQVALWRGDDHDTVYRFRKRHRVKTIRVVQTSFPVPHIKLLTNRPGKDHRPLATCKYGPTRYRTDKESVFYLTEKINVTFHGVQLEVPMYYGVTLFEPVSRHRRPGDKLAGFNPNNMFYIANVYIETEDIAFEPCRWPSQATGFERLDATKVAALTAPQRNVRPRVVSADEIRYDLRSEGSTYTKDLNE